MEIHSYFDVDDVYTTIEMELARLSRVNLETGHYIVVYGKSDLIRDLYEELICEGYKTTYANFFFDDVVLKDTVYLLTVNSDSEVSIELAYSKSGFPMQHDADSAIIFMEDCKQDIIDYCVNTDKHVILFDFEWEDNFKDDSQEYECSNPKKYNLHEERTNRNDVLSLEDAVCSLKPFSEEYYINGVPVGATEFDEKMDEIERMWKKFIWFF